MLQNITILNKGWKNVSWFLQKYYKSNVFNIDNDKKKLLSSKSAYYYDFWLG